ncbi:MAG: molybdopterin molybdenumtransferase MoeA [Chloroflexi bacterium]|nr:MAG: molybdopterin molybdenumtransferase MoeA [Chloroflexota bacterium]
MAESPYPMLSVEAALAAVLAQASPLPPVTIPARQALGYILAGDIRARAALPPFPASVKDGYAVIAADGPGIYPLVGEVTAGRMADFAVTPGTVAYVTTGAPMPPGADAVVMVEQTEKLWPANGAAQVEIRVQVRAGDDVRPVGVDVAAGELVLEAGTRLGPAEIGLLATAGVTDVSIYPRPLVAVLSTGDELVEPGTRLGAGQIWDSNRAMLVAAIAAVGGEVMDLGISGDSQASLEASVQRGLIRADLLLTSGGVSMGDLDLIKPLLEHAGQVHFGRVRLKPGKPITFATATSGNASNAHTCLVFGLPGNPVSSLVTFYLFAVPAIRKLAGYADPNLPRVQARLFHALSLDPARPEYHRATLRWDMAQNCFVAESTGSQSSSRLLSMRTANALLELPEREGELPAGALVTALLIG